MHLLFGKPETMTSDVEFAPNGVDKHEVVHLFYKHFEAILKMSFTTNLEPNALVIEGSQDTLISHHFWMSQQVILKHANEIFDLPFEINGYEFELYESALMIEAGNVEHPLMPHKTTIEMLQWMDEIRQSWGLKYAIE